MMYKQVELKEGELLQFLAVYVSNWREEMGTPETGFREIEYTVDDAIDEFHTLSGVSADYENRVKNIFRKLAGE